mmetsp:Transcript_119/g.88  ORF Transcript_119/g.88 Transcript_119/m.88 type:complete len:85 (-) Transcript_119:23-277(-)
MLGQGATMEEVKRSFGYEVEKIHLTEKIILYKSNDNERIQLKNGHEELMVNNTVEMEEVSEMRLEQEVNEEKSLTQRLASYFFK